MSNLMMMKKGLTSEQLSMVQHEVSTKGKSKGLAYVLWFFTGAIGGHRFYAGDIGIAIAMLLTLGGLGFWALIDALFIGKRIDKKNEELEVTLIEEAKLMSE